MIRFFGRREAIIPLAAFTLAVVGANAVVGLVAQLWIPKASIPMAAMDVALVPAVLLLTQWLLHRMVQSVSGDLLGLLS